MTFNVRSIHLLCKMLAKKVVAGNIFGLINFFMKCFHFLFSPLIPHYVCILKLACIIVNDHITFGASFIILFYTLQIVFCPCTLDLLINIQNNHLHMWNINFNICRHLSGSRCSHHDRTWNNWCLCIWANHDDLGWLCCCKDYLPWEKLKLKDVILQLGPMGVNSLPIEGGFISQNSFLAQECEMVDGLAKRNCK